MKYIHNNHYITFYRRVCGHLRIYKYIQFKKFVSNCLKSENKGLKRFQGTIKNRAFLMALWLFTNFPSHICPQRQKPAFCSLVKVQNNAPN